MNNKVVTRCIILICLILNGLITLAQQTGPDPKYTLLHPEKSEVKNYCFMFLLNQDADAQNEIMNDRIPAEISKSKHLQINSLSGDIGLFLNAALFSTTEIENIGTRINNF